MLGLRPPITSLRAESPGFARSVGAPPPVASPLDRLSGFGFNSRSRQLVGNSHCILHIVEYAGHFTGRLSLPRYGSSMGLNNKDRVRV